MAADKVAPMPESEDRPGDAFATPRTAAAALYLAGPENVLLVHPTYKVGWELPGGYLLPGETPTSALKRELTEELGTRLPVGRLLVVDWAPNDREGDKVLWVFDGGELADDQHAAIRVDGIEIDAYAYYHRDELDDLLIPRLARRVHAAIDARMNGETYYLEHGVRLGEQPSR
jgi:8-oxo-dGTP pyrophosphatase MutT (NUDIX family)